MLLPILLHSPPSIIRKYKLYTVFYLFWTKAKQQIQFGPHWRRLLSWWLPKREQHVDWISGLNGILPSCLCGLCSFRKGCRLVCGRPRQLCGIPLSGRLCGTPRRSLTAGRHVAQSRQSDLFASLRMSRSFQSVSSADVFIEETSALRRLLWRFWLVFLSFFFLFY